MYIEPPSHSYITTPVVINYIVNVLLLVLLKVIFVQVIITINMYTHVYTRDSFPWRYTMRSWLTKKPFEEKKKNFNSHLCLKSNLYRSYIIIPQTLETR